MCRAHPTVVHLGMLAGRPDAPDEVEVEGLRFGSPCAIDTNALMR